jgi:FtsH-binding integral membrane protein
VDVAGITLGFIAVIGGLGISGLAIVLGIRHDWRKRELEHLERMRAFELGRTLPQDQPWLSPARIGAALAIVVPIAAFVSACAATDSAGYQEHVWIAALMVGVAAVVCGSLLVGSSIKKDAASLMAMTKPVVEEDAYDVVGARG